MKKFILKAFCFAALLVAPTAVNAQKLHMNLGLQNTHLWRGMEVADGVIVTAEASVSDNKDHFHFGLWGGTNTEGNYKEFDYYLSYTNKGWTVSLWDFNNFSNVVDGTPQARVFNYRASNTNHFLDLTLGYSFAEIAPKFPLALNWSTVIYGNDRAMNDKGEMKNRYSTYVDASLPIKIDEKWTLTPNLGAAFALNEPANKTNLYGEKFGVVQASLAATYNLEIAKHKMPVTVRLCGTHRQTRAIWVWMFVC